MLFQVLFGYLWSGVRHLLCLRVSPLFHLLEWATIATDLFGALCDCFLHNPLYSFQENRQLLSGEFCYRIYHLKAIFCFWGWVNFSPSKWSDLYSKNFSLQWKELWLSGWIGAVLIPLAHAVCLESDHGVTEGHLPLFLAGMLMAATGALLYITALPEAWFPGQFDIWGHSHQLWHICIFVFTVIDIHVTSDMANQRINLVTEWSDRWHTNETN